MICGNRHFRHSGIDSLFRFLNDGPAAVLFYDPKPLSSIAVATTQNDANNAISVNLSGRDEERVCGGSRVVHFRPTVQTDAPRF